MHEVVFGGMAKDVNVNEVIQFVGVSDLKVQEQETVQSLAEEYYDKIKRQLNNVTNLTVHVKCYEKDGARKKFSINVKVSAPTMVFTSDRADDWELPRAVHEAFQSVQAQINHKLHSDTTHPTRPNR